MSRPGKSAQRPLTATEELEKLEQSITLTLQEIDQNFSKAHRIVTTSILPLVEQYGEHSRAVWEASKFWKQFFEASANVSLSGYEELANDGDTTVAEETTVHDEQSTAYTPRSGVADDTLGTATEHSGAYGPEGDESLLSDAGGDLTGSTPRAPATRTIRPQFAGLDSPYENLRQKLQGGSLSGPGADEDSTVRLNAETDDNDNTLDSSALLAERTARLPDMSMTPRASLAAEEEAERQETAARHKDPLLHRVLNKNYRIQSTPHKAMTHGVSPIKWKVTEKPAGAAANQKATDAGGTRPAWQDSPMSSPEMEAPKLRSEAFMSPFKAAYRAKLGAAATANVAPRTPGVSVRTPAMGKKTRDVFATGTSTKEGAQGKGKDKARWDDEDEITWESDSDREYGPLYGGMSPPKTIQFALPPSKLLQTPAREASKRIVDDILLTAGAEMEESSEYSPIMVKMNANLDDTF